MKVAAYVPDLMDRSRFAKVNADVSFARRPEELATLAADADTVVVDLGRPGVIDLLGQFQGKRVLGFCSHVDRELAQRASEEGAEVFARSVFFSRVVNSLGSNGHEV